MCRVSVGGVWGVGEQLTLCPSARHELERGTKYGSWIVSNSQMWCGEPPGTRTLNPLIKSQLLCQLS